MRFAALVLAVVIGGTALGDALDALQPSRNPSDPQATQSASPNMSYGLRDLNPIRLAFDYVQQQIRRPLRPSDLGFVATTPLKPFDFNKTYGTTMHFDPVEMSRMNGDTIFLQNRLMQDRAQEMAYQINHPGGTYWPSPTGGPP